jgi:SAM-dependent methyltransferase
MSDRLTTKGNWEDIWRDTRLPAINNPIYDIANKLKMYLPKNPDNSFIEIGCAPGRWMGYFNKKFGYRVSGIEYAENAAEITKQNMKMQNIDAEVIVQDFLTFDCSRHSYNIVFSAGFVEHFQDTAPVVEKICSLSNKYVITLIPNCLGLNGFISKTIRPEVYAQHKVIDVPALESFHKNCGLKTLFCNYVGGARLIMPCKGVFSNRHYHCAKAINLPVRIFNRLSSELSNRFKFVPRTMFFSESLMYIGCRQD